MSAVVVPDGQTGAFSNIVTNNGDFSVAPDGTLITFLAPASSGAVLQGKGGKNDRVRLGGQSVARLGDFKTSFTNAANHKIDGAGIIFGGMTNLGTVEANHADGQHLIIFPPGGKVNHGTLQATDGGVLRIADHITGSGNLIALGGRIIITPNVSVVGSDIDVPPGSVSFLDIGVSPAGAAT